MRARRAPETRADGHIPRCNQAASIRQASRSVVRRPSGGRRGSRGQPRSALCRRRRAVGRPSVQPRAAVGPARPARVRRLARRLDHHAVLLHRDPPGRVPLRAPRGVAALARTRRPAPPRRGGRSGCPDDPRAARGRRPPQSRPAEAINVFLAQAVLAGRQPSCSRRPARCSPRGTGAASAIPGGCTRSRTQRASRAAALPVPGRAVRADVDPARAARRGPRRVRCDAGHGRSRRAARSP